MSKQSEVQRALCCLAHMTICNLSPWDAGLTSDKQATGPQQGSSQSHLAGGAIAGIVVGALAACVLGAALAFLLFRRRKSAPTGYVMAQTHSLYTSTQL